MKSPAISQLKYLIVIYGTTLNLTHAQPILTDLELSLVTDISGSVDSTEYALQMGGYSQAFRNPILHNAIMGGAIGQIAVNLVFFDDFASEGLPFTLLGSGADAIAFADMLDALARPRSGSTNPAAGIDLATAGMLTNNFDGTRLVIDVSGDGEGFAFSDAAARDAALAAGIDTINGLPIGPLSLEDYYRDFIVGGDGAFVNSVAAFEDFEASVLEKLRREISGDPGVASNQMISSLRATSITLSRFMVRDVGHRLYRLRAGIRPEGRTISTPAPGSKGGMSKGVIESVTEARRWEVYGQIFYTSEDQDEQTQNFGTVAVVPFVTHGETSVDIFGGHVGFEYDFNEKWSAGFAVSGANTDIDVDGVGDADIDTVALIPYVSYYHRGLVGSGDFYADLLYAYSDSDYDTEVLGTSSSTDGSSHQIELNSGLNFHSGTVTHGPYASLRWIEGEIEGYIVSAGDDVDYDSLATQLGYQVSLPFTVKGGKLVPQVRLAWEHEFESDQGNLAGIPLGDLDDDLAVLGVGVGYFMDNGWNVSLDYEGRLGSESESNYVSLKAGFEF